MPDTLTAQSPLSTLLERLRAHQPTLLVMKDTLKPGIGQRVLREAAPV